MQRDGLWMALTLVVACDAERADEVEARAMVLNTSGLNGIQLNGIQLNGIQLNGIQLGGIQLGGIQLSGIQLGGSSFSGTVDSSGGAKLVAGAALIGAEFKLAGNGTTYTLRFDDIFRDPAHPDGDVYFYAISARDDAVGTWASLCTDPDGAPTEAIPLAGVWDANTGARADTPGAVTFACRHAALAKCVEWGYVPWRTSPVALRDHHQACTRMVRADYCGDGTSYTFDGTPIDVYDRFSPPINLRSTQGRPGWVAEAEWGPNGATCIGPDLRLEMIEARGTPFTPPGCLGGLKPTPNCGTLPPSRASRLANAYCAGWTSDPAACQGHGDDDLPGRAPP